MTPEYSVFALNNLQGCPITNTAFKLEIRINGERIKADKWYWVPNAILREGTCGRWSAQTYTLVVKGLIRHDSAAIDLKRCRVIPDIGVLLHICMKIGLCSHPVFSILLKSPFCNTFIHCISLKSVYYILCKNQSFLLLTRSYGYNEKLHRIIQHERLFVR